MIEKNSNVPRIIDRLEVKELVVRSSSNIDKRETVVTLTEDGATLLKVATAAVDKAFENVVEVNEKDATLLNGLLENYRKNE
jgi:DNA-binding MarR family transcriptional regulator